MQRTYSFFIVARDELGALWGKEYLLPAEPNPLIGFVDRFKDVFHEFNSHHNEARANIHYRLDIRMYVMVERGTVNSSTLSALRFAPLTKESIDSLLTGFL